MGFCNRQCNFPRQLTTDSIGRVFISDRLNDRIYILLDLDLNHLRNVTHQSILRPYDVKVSRDRLYVLCPYDNPCLHVLTIGGDKLQASLPYYQWRRNGSVRTYILFRLDPLNNFVLCDYKSNSLHVFLKRATTYIGEPLQMNQFEHTVEPR